MHITVIMSISTTTSKHTIIHAVLTMHTTHRLWERNETSCIRHKQPTHGECTNDEQYDTGNANNTYPITISCSHVIPSLLLYQALSPR